MSPQTAGKAGIETKTETNESTDFSVFDDILDSMRTNNDMKDLSNERTWFAIRAYVTGYGPIANRRPLAAAGVSQLLDKNPEAMRQGGAYRLRWRRITEARQFRTLESPSLTVCGRIARSGFAAVVHDPLAALVAGMQQPELIVHGTHHDMRILKPQVAFRLVLVKV